MSLCELWSPVNLHECIECTWLNWLHSLQHLCANSACLQMLGELAASNKHNRDRVARFVRTHPEFALVRARLQYHTRLLSHYRPLSGPGGMESRPACAVCARLMQALALPRWQPGMYADVFLQPQIPQVPLGVVIDLLARIPYSPELYASCSEACSIRLYEYRKEMRKAQISKDVCILQLTHDPMHRTGEATSDQWTLQTFPLYLVVDADAAPLNLPRWLQENRWVKTRHEGRMLALVAIDEDEGEHQQWLWASSP